MNIAAGYVVQILLGTLVTMKVAVSALLIGLIIGLVGSILESIRTPLLKYTLAGVLFLARGLPELLVLFFIYFGVSSLSVNISAFTAGVTALSLIFGAYASEVFRGAFLAVDTGQMEAGKSLGLTAWQIFIRIQLPQAWRHALPGLSNLWLVLLKDTAIVTLIGLTDMMNAAKMAASTTHQPFVYYLMVAMIYLLITSLSQWLLNFFIHKSNRYVSV